MSAPRSAYIHVPFCKHRCGYCDFAIITGADDLQAEYLAALDLELSRIGGPHEVDTLYFGGGTPSHLEAEQLDQLCRTATRHFPLAAGHEWTVEANPESLPPASLDVLARHGVTRISLGAQSLHEPKLRVLDRQHTAADVRRLVGAIKRSGLQASIDLIFAAPGETRDAWRRDVAAAVELEPDHVSAYGLTFENRTPFSVRRARGELVEVDEELQRGMYGAAIDDLAAAGYEHYEVSNFARPGRRSRHNEAYWTGREYFAAGPGAARYVAGVRETNLRSTTAWMRRVRAGEPHVEQREMLTPEGRARERLVFSLRRMDGARRDEFARETGYEIDALAGETIAWFVSQGWLADDGDRVRLTRDGLYISDALWPRLL
jgi:oxygen-independent coproporphyrinogen-3 oxidase